MSAVHRDNILALKNEGLGPAAIARQVGCHVQTVYYWLSPKRREAMLRKSVMSFRIAHIGGRRQTKAQRDEILAAYLEDPCKGTALACHRGLSPLYAYKLAMAMGAIPRKGEQ